MAYDDIFEADWSPTAWAEPVQRLRPPTTKEEEEDVFSGDWKAEGEKQTPTLPKPPRPWVETAAIEPKQGVKARPLEAGMGTFKAGGAGWETGDIMVELAELQHKNMWGATLTEQERNRISELKAKMPKDADKLKILEEALYSAGQLGPMMVKSAKYAVAGAATGAAVGAGVGAAGFGAGALPGAAMGAKIGATGGAAAAAFELEAGLAFDELLDLKDENGNRLDPEIARAAAMGIGGINAAIELAQIKTLLKFMPGGQQVLRSLGVRAIKKALENKTFGKMLWKAGKDFGKFAATETLQEVSQETTNIVGEEISKWYDELDNDKDFRNLIESDPSGKWQANWEVAKEHAKRIGGIARQTALGMGVIGLPGLGTRVYKGTKEVRRKRAEEGAPQEILTEAEELGFDPNQAQTFVDTVYGGEATVEDLEAYGKELDPKSPTFKALQQAITQLRDDEKELEEIDLIEDQAKPQAAREDIATASPDKQQEAEKEERDAVQSQAQEQIMAQAQAFEQYIAQQEQQALIEQEQDAMAAPVREELPIQPTATPEETFYPEEAAPTTEEGMAATGAPDVFTADWEPAAPTEAPAGAAPLISAIDQGAKEAEPEPTEAQQEAGNYKKGHIQLQGLDITIENARGSVRRGVDKAGKRWETQMQNHYGYIRRTIDGTGEQLDVFLGSEPTSDKAFVVHQVNPKTGKFDEYKVMLGFGNEEAARKAYLANYEEGWKGLGKIEPMQMDQFKAWMKAAQLKPEKKPVKEAEPKKKGWSTDFDTAATVAVQPGEPIEVFGDNEAALVYTEDEKYSIARKDESFVLNPKTQNALFDTAEEAKIEFERQMKAGPAKAEKAVKSPSQNKREWFELGRSVNLALPRETGLKPNDAAFVEVAGKMGITKADARRAWEVYSFDAEVPTKEAPTEQAAPVQKVPAKAEIVNLEDVKVKVKAVREATGKEVTVKVSAREALNEIQTKKTVLENMLECLAK